MGRLLLVVGVTAALIGSAPAEAASVREDMLQGLVYEAGPGEANDVELSYSGGFYFVRDVGATLTAADEACVELSQHEARCINTGFPWVFINLWLGDGDDHATIVSVDESQHPDWRIRGEAGDDTMSSTTVADGLISGGDGDDVVGTFFGSASGGLDTDTLDFSDAGFGKSVDLAAGTASGFGTIDTIENVLAGNGDDILRGSDAANRLEGRGGDDLIDGRFGPDDLVGGAGFDVVDYSDRADAVLVLPGLTAISGNDDDGLPIARDLVHQDVEGAFGGDGDDIFIGTGADNLFNGGFGADEFTGFGGFDLVDYSDRTADVTVMLTGQANSGNADDGPEGARDLVAADVEDVISGSGDDTLVGNGVDNFFDGGFGADTMNGGPGDDLVDYSRRGLGVNVVLDGTPRSGNEFDIGAGGGRDVLVSIEDALGGEGWDNFFGSADSNVFFGGAGNDVLQGEGGEDRLSGDSGNDTIRSQDGAVDDVSCGEDVDLAQTERADVVSADCETIDQGPPALGPTVARDITSNGATLTSFINPNRSTSGAAFQLGTTTAYGMNVFAIGPVNGNDDIPVTVQVKGLLPSTTYHVRLTASSGRGVAYGPDATFTTAGVPPLPPLRPVTPVRCIVPNLKGKTLAAGRRALRRANCRLGRVTRAYSRGVPKGRIFRQSRRPRARLANGAKVGVVLSRGKKPRARPRRR